VTALVLESGVEAGRSTGLAQPASTMVAATAYPVQL
jgi:hypothetical protein